MTLKADKRARRAAEAAAGGAAAPAEQRLVDLDPRWVGAGGDDVTHISGTPVPRREGVGIAFDCPCGCGARCYVQFENPRDGGPQHNPQAPAWRREGDDFGTLTLSPSIQRADPHGCRWHGFVRSGAIKHA